MKEIETVEEVSLPIELQEIIDINDRFEQDIVDAGECPSCGAHPGNFRTREVYEDHARRDRFGGWEKVRKTLIVTYCSNCGYIISRQTSRY